MFKNSENAPDTKVSKWPTQNRPYLQNNSELEHGGGFAGESYDRSLRSAIQFDHLCRTKSDCRAWVLSKIQVLCKPQIPSGISMTLLNKKYSRYYGTEAVRPVLCPSKSIKYVFKNSEVCRKRGNCW